MRVVQAERPGPPDVLRVVEAPDPVPGPCEAVIGVSVAAVHVIETMVRAGRSPRPDPPSFPLVPGNNVGGTVLAVGDGADPGLVGRTVVSTTGGSGGYAERVAVPVDLLYELPDGLDLRSAVALLGDGRTAVGLARAADPGPGDRVLVTAAGGGVGSLLVQLARAAGVAGVVALAGGERKLALARDLGAAVTVDYRQPGWRDEVRAATGGHGVDVAFDGVGGEIGVGVVELLAPRARLVIHGLVGGSFTEVDPAAASERQLAVMTLADVLSTPEEQRAATRDALRAAADGRLVATVGQTFPLERAADAHAAIESRSTLGRTLLLVG